MACAQYCVDADSSGRIRTLLHRELDWDYLIRQARRQGMMPLLFWALDQMGSEPVPVEYWRSLSEQYRQNGYENLLKTKSLIAVLERFKEHGIEVVPYKGPVLAQQVYGNLSLRHFVDVDILVRKKDVRRSCDLLVSWGYRPQRALPQASPDALWRLGQVTFFGDAVIELVWELAPVSFAFPLDPERLWSHLQPVILGGTEAQTFSPEDMLLLLCVHGTKHHWERLAWICDVAKLVSVQDGMDWQRAFRMADEYGIGRMVCLGLFLSNSLLGLPLSPIAMQRIESDPRLKELNRQVQSWLFGPSDGPGEMSVAFFHLRVIEHWPDRMRYSVGRITATNRLDRDAHKLTQSVSLFQYLLRPFRLLSEYGLAYLRGWRDR